MNGFEYNMGNGFISCLLCDAAISIYQKKKKFAFSFDWN